MQITQRANTEVKNEALAAAQRKIREQGIYPTDKFWQVFSQVQRNFSSPLFFVVFVTWPFLSTVFLWSPLSPQSTGLAVTSTLLWNRTASCTKPCSSCCSAGISNPHPGHNCSIVAGTGNMLKVSVLQKGKEAFNSFSLKTEEVHCKFLILEAQGIVSNSFSWVSGSRRGTSSLAEAASIPPETTDIKWHFHNWANQPHSKQKLHLSSQNSRLFS